MQAEKDYFIDVKTSFTEQIKDKSPDEISLEYSYLTLDENFSFVKEVFTKLGIKLSGEGMEVAAGAAVLPCSVAKIYPDIKKIYALEIVEKVVTDLQPKIIEATGMKNIVIPMVGDFNDIKMPDKSLDFVIGYSSLHHSNDLKRTLAEIGRVLKPGGKLIFFDRAHPNHLTKAQENFLLNKEYNREYKIKHGINPDIPYHRFEEGEHEPRIRDWEQAFKGSGMRWDSLTIFTKITFKVFVIAAAALVPFVIRKKINFFPSIIEHNKLLFFCLFPPIGQFGKIKIFKIHTKFKTTIMFTGMKHMVFTATKNQD